ncbi:MAG: hypothetical protein R3200_14220 [Xanthomonadales bacterium]|nr:hypothetical protein [Xanthomonadales bacterium]
MPGRSTFSDSTVFKHVALSLIEHGDLKLDRLSSDSGVSMGSLYHRYGSREGLMGRAWLTAVEAFHEIFLEAIDKADLKSGVEAALATPRFCRANPSLAAILACCRQAEFIEPGASPDLAGPITEANRRPAEALRAFAERVDRRLLACRLALLDWPLAVVRPYLPRRRVPDSADEYVVRGYWAALSDSPPKS